MIFDPEKIYSVIVFDDKFQFEDWQNSHADVEIADVTVLPVVTSEKIRFFISVIIVRGTK